MNETPDAYRTMAKYYDEAYHAKTDLVDLPFYMDLVREHGGPVLELGCGTGRVTLAVAREGIPVEGVDASTSMLQVLQRKLAEEAESVHRMVKIHHADIRNMKLGRTFPLVIIPFRPMQHMYTTDDQLAALDAAKSHLEEKGILAFDVFFPKFEKLFAGIGEESLELEWQDADSGRTIRRFFRKDTVDKVNQTFSGTFIFRTYENGRLLSEETEGLKMNYYTYPQLQLLFRLVGLKPLNVYGSFDKKPLSDLSPQMIFVLGRK